MNDDEVFKSILHDIKHTPVEELKKELKEHSKEDFIRLCMCSFESDPIYIELENNIRKYYKDSEKLNDKAARELHKEVKRWVKACGFTNKEYNDARRKVTGEYYEKKNNNGE